MGFLSIVRTALWSLGRNKTRTGLTMLGIIIGVGSVIAMVSLGQGAMKAVEDQIAQMGLNTVTVQPGSRARGGFHGGAGSVKTLIPEDLVAIVNECPSVRCATPLVRGSAQIVFQNRNRSTTMQGVSLEFPLIRDWKISSGSFFDRDQERRAAKVCVVGQTIVDDLFFGNDPVGQVVRVKNIPCLVIGVLADKGQSSTGQDQDDVVLVPWTTAQRKFLGITHLQQIVTSAIDEASSAAAKAEITTVLRRRHRTHDEADDDFSVQTQTEVAETRQQTASFMMKLVVVVAAVALIVGGIGVMNIMLVTVLERTREIGIRMAIGARPSDVLLQFLGEAVVLTSLGGLIGIGLGIAIAMVVPLVLGWPTRLSTAPMFVSFVFSATVGIFFGLYPALRASRLDPIDALRYE